MWLSILGAAIYAGRGIYAYLRRGELPKERERPEEPDFGQLIILGAVAATVLLSIPLGFWLLATLSEMRR
jgi:hypothetical protein